MRSTKGCSEMAEAQMGAKIVRVRMKEGRTGLFFATSPDLTGLLVAEETIDGLKRAVPGAIEQMYAACGEPVVVTWVENSADSDRSCVAFPAALAKQALKDNAAA